MGVKIRKSHGKLYLDIHVNGKRHWEALGLSVTQDRQQNKEVIRLAEICRSKRETQIVSGEWGLLDPVNGKQTLHHYITELGKSKDKKHQLNRVLKYLDSYRDGGISIGHITEKWLENFQEYLLKESGLAKRSASSYASAIRYALKKAARDRIIPRNPAEGVKTIPLPDCDKIHLTFDEVQRLAKTPLGGELGAAVKRAFLFACFTGLRIFDLKTLKWSDISRDPLQIQKQQKKTGSKVFVPLHPVAWGIINDGALHNYMDPVFPRISGLVSTVSHYLYRWAGKAGIDKNLGWHTARHTFAVMSLEYGAEIYTVSKLLGHTNLQTTQVYARATDKMKREAVSALPQIEIV